MSEAITYVLPDSSRKPARRRPRPHTTRDQAISVLVVDDHRDIREMYESYFRFMGTRVFLGRDGIDALQVVHHFQPDAVVLDLAMPRMTGWEVLDNLREVPPRRRPLIVALTGQNASREQTLKAGADLHLTKPCLPQVLFGLIVDALSGAGRGRA
jgi:CheY-like chemotaxis protein